MQGQAPGTQDPGLRAWIQGPGTRPALGSVLRLGTWGQAPGTRDPGPGTHSIVYEVWNSGPGRPSRVSGDSVLLARHPVPGTRDPGPGTRDPGPSGTGWDPGSGFSEPGPGTRIPGFSLAGCIPRCGTDAGLPTWVKSHRVAYQSGWQGSGLSGTILRYAVGSEAFSSARVSTGTTRSDGTAVTRADSIPMGSARSHGMVPSGIWYSKSRGNVFAKCAEVCYTKGGVGPGPGSGSVQALSSPDLNCA